jgi:hypothetical protein
MKPTLDLVEGAIIANPGRDQTALVQDIAIQYGVPVKDIAAGVKYALGKLHKAGRVNRQLELYYPALDAD